MGRDLEFGIRITADGRVLVAEAGRAEKAIGSIGKTVEDVNRNTGALTASFARMGQAAAAAFSAREVIQAADAFTTLNARLALVSAGATAAAVAYQRVYEIAQATRQGVSEVGLIYERFGRRADALGLSQQRLAEITTSVSQAMVISGSSAESSRAALMQLGQGIASGTLRGEELNSVMEQAPRLAQALADGLDVPIGTLRELGEAGQLTAEKLVEALTKQAPVLAAEFARMPVTVGQALVNVRNAWTDTVGSFEQSTGAFRVVADGLQGVATHMDAVATVGGTVAAVMAGRVAGSLATVAAGHVAAASAAVQDVTAKNQAAAASARLAAADIETARTASVSAAARLAEAQAVRAAAIEIALYGPQRAAIEREVVAASAAHVAATNAVAAAEARLTAASAGSAAAMAAKSMAARGAAAVVGALGGPIGAITTVLALGATAWAIWGDSAKSAADKARDALRAAQEEAARLGKRDTDLVRQQFDAAAARYYENMGDPKARAEWMKLGDLLRELETRDKNLAAQMKSSAASALDAWNNSKLGTKAEEQSRKLAELAQQYNAAMQEAVKLGKSDKELAQIVATYTARVTELNKVGAAKTAVTHAMADASTEQAKLYAQQYEAAAKLAMGIGLEAEAGRKLLPVEQAIAVAKETLTAAQAAEIEKVLAGALAFERKTAAEKDAAEIAKIHADYVRENLDPLDQQIRALEREIDNYGKTEGAIQRTAAARLQEARALAAANGAWPEHLAYLDAEIEKRTKLAAAADSKDALEANGRAVDEMQRDWEKMHDQLSQSLTDALMSGGMDAGELLKRYFATLVLRPVIQGVVSAGMNALGLGGSSASGGGFDLLGTANAANSVYGAAQGGGLYGAFATSSVGQSLGLSYMSHVGATGPLATAAPTLSSLGSAIPYVAAAIAIASMFSKESTPHAGGIAFSGGQSYSLPTTREDIFSNFSGASLERKEPWTSSAWNFSESDWTSRNDAGMSAQIGQIGEGFARTFNEILKANNIAAGYSLGLAFSADGDDPARGRAAIINQAGGILAGYRDTNNLGKDAGKAMQKFVGEELPQLLLSALEDLDLNTLADSYLDSLDIDRLSADMAQQALGFVDASDEIIDAFEKVGISASDVTYDLIKAMGGFDAAGAAITAMAQQIAAIEQQAAGTSAMFAGSIRSIEMSVLDDPGKYNYLDAEVQRYRDVLSSLTDATLIAQYADKANSSLMQAYGLLDANQQRATSSEFIERARDLEELALARYDAAKDEVTAQAKEIAAAVKQAVKEALEESTASNTDATTQNTTAVQQLTDRIGGGLRIDVGGLATSEVGGWSGGGG